MHYTEGLRDLISYIRGSGPQGFLGPPQRGHPVSSRERGGVRPSCSHMDMENVAHTQGLCPRRKEAGSSLALKGCRRYFGKGVHTALRVTSDLRLSIQVLQDLMSAFTLSSIQLHYVSFKARTSKEIRVKKSAKEAHTRTQELLKYFWKAGQVKAVLYTERRKFPDLLFSKCPLRKLLRMGKALEAPTPFPVLQVPSEHEMGKQSNTLLPSFFCGPEEVAFLYGPCCLPNLPCRLQGFRLV